MLSRGANTCILLVTVLCLGGALFAVHPTGRGHLVRAIKSQTNWEFAPNAQLEPTPSPEEHACPPATVIEKEVVVEKVVEKIVEKEVEKEVEKIVVQTSAPTLSPSWHRTVDRSVELAKGMLKGKDTSNRVIIPLLTSRHQRLCCFFQNFAQNAFNSTPADVFVMSIDNGAQAVVEKLCPQRLEVDYIYFLALDEFWEDSWEAGDFHHWVEYPAQDQNEEWNNGFKNYRRMGHWRLLFPTAFAKALGYPWYWQLDDDSHLLEPIDMNLIDWARDKNVSLAAHRVTKEPHTVTWGLPELARFFIISEQMKTGTLLEKWTDPPGLDGLFTTKAVDPVTKAWNKTAGPEGWRQAVLYGNCVLMSVDFFQREDVQKFVHLVVSSGGHSKHRWNEQAVVGIIWQMFLNEEEFAMIPISYEHRSEVGCDPVT